MRVGRRGARRGVLLFSEQSLEFVRGRAPIVRRVRGKQIGESAPSRVLDENVFLVRCRLATLDFDSLQRPNGGEISVCFLLQTAFADGVGAGYTEVAGKR